MRIGEKDPSGFEREIELNSVQGETKENKRLNQRRESKNLLESVRQSFDEVWTKFEIT